ncbi:MAG TPA: hypothetical protein VF487_04095 [Chitinophagaceae bacterium]
MISSLNKLIDLLLFFSYIHEWFGMQNVNRYFAPLLQMKHKRTYSILQRTSAVFLILALLWLTVSIPFVYENQLKHAQQDKIENSSTPLTGDDEETSNPFGNTTEEKAPSTSTVSEEYLHDHHHTDYFFSIALQYHKCEDAGTYIAFHGELLVPPPNAA